MHASCMHMGGSIAARNLLDVLVVTSDLPARFFEAAVSAGRALALPISTDNLVVSSLYIRTMAH
jgi:hypothetical protein